MQFNNKIDLCVHRVRELELDSARMVFTSLNHTFDINLKEVSDFNNWINSLLDSQEAEIDLVCKVLGVDTQTEN